MTNVVLWHMIRIFLVTRFLYIKYNMYLCTKFGSN